MTKDTHSDALPEDTPYSDLDALLDAAASAAGPAAAATPAERARWLSAAADALDGAATSWSSWPPPKPTCPPLPGCAANWPAPPSSCACSARYWPTGPTSAPGWTTPTRSGRWAPGPTCAG